MLYLNIRKYDAQQSIIYVILKTRCLIISISTMRMSVPKNNMKHSQLPFSLYYLHRQNARLFSILMLAMEEFIKQQ